MDLLVASLLRGPKASRARDLHVTEGCRLQSALEQRAVPKLPGLVAFEPLRLVLHDVSDFAGRMHESGGDGWVAAIDGNELGNHQETDGGSESDLEGLLHGTTPRVGATLNLNYATSSVGPFPAPIRQTTHAESS